MQNYRGYAGFRPNKPYYSANPYEGHTLLREGIQMFVPRVEEMEIDSTSAYLNTQMMAL